MAARVAVLVLAAGRSRRFDADGRQTKVVAHVRGVPLVRAVTVAARRSRAETVTVVTGHDREAVEAALNDLDVRFVHNADFASGLAGSLKAGLATLPKNIYGALVMLADMPLVTTETLDRLIERFAGGSDTLHAVVPVFEKQRGNPVLIGRRLFAAVEALEGDEGARRLLSARGLVIARCEVDDPGVTLDIDTVADLAAVEAKG